MVYLDQILHTYLFRYYPVIGVQNGDQTSPSIICAGQREYAHNSWIARYIFDQILHIYAY